MGSELTKFKNADAESDYFCICSAHGSDTDMDTIMAIHGDVETRKAVQGSIERRAPCSIRNVSSYVTALSIELSKAVLWDWGSEESQCQSVEEMLFHLVNDVHRHGWELVLYNVMSSNERMNTLFFRRMDQLPSHDLIGLSRDRWDKIYVHYGGEKIESLVKHSIETVHDIEDESQVDDNCYQFKLPGMPWPDKDDIEESLVARRVGLEIIQNFHLNGYRLYGNLMTASWGDNLYYTHDPSIVQQGVKWNFFIFSLIGNSTVRLQDADAGTTELVKSCLNKNWHKGVQDYRYHKEQGCFEVELLGDPWIEASGEDHTRTNLLLLLLLQGLLEGGWRVHCTLDVSRRSTENAVFVMRTSAPMALPHMCICPMAPNKLKIINAPGDLAKTIGETVKSHSLSGSSKQQWNEGAWTIKLSGQPWKSSVLTKHVMLKVFAKLHKMGWTVMACADALVVGYDGWRANGWFMACIGDNR